MGKKLKLSTIKTVLLGAVLALAFGQAPFVFASGDVQLSNNWSGYMSTQGKFTEIHASWLVPNVSVSPEQNFSGDMTWAGIGGFSSTDLIQAGTLALVGNGSVTYKAWYEILPYTAQMTDLTVRAGDSVSVKIGLQPNNLWLIELTNNTIGQTFRTTVFYNSSFSSAEWIEEMPTLSTRANNFLQLDNFGVVNFTSAGATANGNFVSLLQSGAKAINMIGPQAETLASASELDSGGSAFSVSRPAPLAPSPVASSQALPKALPLQKAQKSFNLKARDRQKPGVSITPRGPMPEPLVLR